MPIKIMEVKKKKKKKTKWHDVIEDDSSRAKVWPARAVEEEKEEDDDDEDGGEGLGHRKLSSALMNVLASISFAEAMQNSSTLYGVSVIGRAWTPPLTPKYGNRSACTGVERKLNTSRLRPRPRLPCKHFSQIQYAMIGTALTMVIVVGIGSLPFTIWNAEGDGVPRADEWIYCLVIICLYCGGSAGLLFYGGMYSSFDPPTAPKLHLGWLHTWRARIPAIFASGWLSSGAISLLPLAFGASTRFLLFDSVSFVVGFPLLSVAGEIASRWSAGDKAPVRQSVRQIRRHSLLLRDDEGEARVRHLKACTACLSCCFSVAPTLALYDI